MLNYIRNIHADLNITEKMSNIEIFYKATTVQEHNYSKFIRNYADENADNITNLFSFEEGKYKALLFYDVCDLLSVDFDSISNKLLNLIRIKKSPKFEDVYKIFFDESFLLPEYDFVMEILDFVNDESYAEKLSSNLTENDLNKLQNELVGELKLHSHYIGLLQEYFNQSYKKQKLFDYKVFQLFARSFLFEGDFSESKRYIYKDSHKLDSEHENKEVSWKPLYIERSYRGVNCNPEKLVSEFCSSIKSEKEVKEINLETKGSAEYVCKVISVILESGLLIKKCESCDKWFVPYRRSDTLYCDRKSPNIKQGKEKTCREYENWYVKLQKNESANLHRQIYQARQMRFKRNPGLPNYKTSFEDFKEQSKRWKNDIKLGKKTEAEYLHWLKEEKERRY